MLWSQFMIFFIFRGDNLRCCSLPWMPWIPRDMEAGCGSDYNGWEAIFDCGNLKKIPIIMAVIGKGFYIGELYYILFCYAASKGLTMFDYVWLVQVEFPLFLAIKFVDGHIRHKISSCFLLTIFTRWLYIHYIWWWCELSNDLEPWATYKNDDRMYDFNHCLLMDFSHELSKIVR